MYYLTMTIIIKWKLVTDTNLYHELGGGTPHASPVLANGTPGLSTGGRSAGGGDASAQRANGDAAAGASGSQEDNGDRTGRSAGEVRGYFGSLL